LPARSGETPLATWRRAVEETLAMLAPFARVTNVSLTTASEGDDTVILNGPDVAGTLAMLDEHPDGVIVNLRLLDCLDAEGKPFTIPDGAFMLIDRETEDGSVDLFLFLEWISMPGARRRRCGTMRSWPSAMLRSSLAFLRT
jgi:hypothetical protein